MSVARRQAYTLIEMLVVIAITGVALSTAVVTIHMLHRADYRLRDDLRDQNTLEQLSRRLRQDAHQAREALLSEGQADSLTLLLGEGHKISYTLRSGSIDRVDQLAGDMAHRDSFELIALAAQSWLLDSSHPRQRLVLRLVPRDLPTRPQGGEDLEVTVVAAVGVNR